MASGYSQTICENTVEDLADILQKLNMTCAALENAEVKKNGGRDLLKIIKSADTLLERISAKAEKCVVICGKIQLQQESAMKRKAVLMEGRDSGFSGSGFYAQETGENEIFIIFPTEDEEFHSVEEPTSSNGKGDP